jgi:hypothetical protein
LVQWVTVGLSGGLLNYVKVHENKDEANKDGNRIAKNYGIASWDEDDIYQVYVAPSDGSW